jgi:hypothetical protein
VVGRHTDHYLPHPYPDPRDALFTTSGPDGIDQAAGRIFHCAASHGAQDSEEMVVLGVDLGAPKPRG